MDRKLHALLGLLVGVAPSVEAQRVAVPGDTVRVELIGVPRRVSGVVESVTDQGVTIRHEDGEPSILNPPSIRSADILAGRQAKLGRGALIGAGFGVVIGLVAGLGDTAGLYSDEGLGAVMIPIMMAAGGVAGGAVGAVVGGTCRCKRWVPGRFVRAASLSPPTPGEWRPSPVLRLGAESTVLLGIGVRR